MVCTLSKVSVGRHNYYTEVVAKDDYYRQGGENPGRYFGRGAELLSVTNLDIGYKDTTFRNLLFGKSPDGTVLRDLSVANRKSPSGVKEGPVLAWDFPRKGNCR